jgi:geranylgeranyl diphosphate synthase type II
MKEFQDKLAAIEASLNRMDLPHSPANLYEPIHYFLALGGKRIRPLFTILCAELYGIPIKESMPAALSLELFHNFTLIHDDIMDKAPVRRGLATVHEKWNTNIAILSGDVLMMESFRLLEQYDASKYKRLLTLLQKTAVEVCEGQQLDMDSFENFRFIGLFLRIWRNYWRCA